MHFPHPHAPAGLQAALLAALITASVVIGCTEPGPTVRPTGSPFSPGSLSSPAGPATLVPTRSPSVTLTVWPQGWDSAFCAAFAEVVIAQELAVDVERAMDEEATDDARALAAELSTTASAAAELLNAVPAWQPGQDALGEMSSLMDAGRRAGEQYVRYLTEDRRRALNRARELRDAIRDTVPAANRALEQLGEAGLSCPGHPLELESP
jgi:hypothetical protein